MRRIVLVAAVLMTALAFAWNLPYVAAQFMVPVFFGSAAVALLIVTTKKKTSALSRRGH